MPIAVQKGGTNSAHRKATSYPPVFEDEPCESNSMKNHLKKHRWYCLRGDAVGPSGCRMHVGLFFPWH
jgi:hypothetical protein